MYQASFTDKNAEDLLNSHPDILSVTNVEQTYGSVNTAFSAQVSLANRSQVRTKIRLEVSTFQENTRFNGETHLLKHLQDTEQFSPADYYDSGRRNSYHWLITCKDERDFTLSAQTESGDPEVSKGVGETLAKINSINIKDVIGEDLAGELVKRSDKQESIQNYAVATPYAALSWPLAFQKQATEILDNACNEFDDLVEPVQQVIDSSTNALPETEHQKLVHGDFWWGNISQTVEPHEIPQKPTDFEVRNWWRGGGGHPLWNLAVADYMLFESEKWDGKADKQEMRDAFWEGYTEIRDIEWNWKTKEQWKYYELYSRLRAMRGFNYWWKNASTEHKDNVREQIRRDVYDICNGNHVREPWTRGLGN